MEEKIHTLLTRIEDEIYVNVFKSQSDVIDYISHALRQVWENMHWEEDISDEDRQALYDLQDKAEKAIIENGYWNDGNGTEYRYEEKEFTE